MHGGLSFDGMKTTLRLARVLAVSSTEVSLAPGEGNTGLKTGTREVPRTAIEAVAVLRVPMLALPLRWAQQGAQLSAWLPRVAAGLYEWALLAAREAPRELGARHPEGLL
eukprot:TRINITY_DN13090_c0_g1_i1.p2 TRINITY_DN13090_c0_g1~~TRINITY_DN13090_c0_g1_i1.p2  ORF type:complete len:110 (-),score=32.02 TRINITY_DN13090_c0_g1_i1:186-515(-)